ncbi:MAG: putative ABC transporter permease protein [Acetothermia bacterium 64_32]|nr:MAG: putative ABC transporter permease protein [Acetothermia bacterium 64_32]HAF70360.1 ABC transporter permease [Candidatus Acetothermia bacterium]
MARLSGWFTRHPLWVLVIPLGLVAYFVYGGLLWNFWVSVSDWRGLVPSYSFRGFDHYARLFSDPVFWTSLKNTAILFFTIPLCILLGLGVAVLLDQGLLGSTVFRNLYLLPFALSFVVTGTIWAWMYNPTSGIINTLLRSIGLGALQGTWHTSQRTVMGSIILALVWQFSGYAALVLLAGIRSVPEVQIKAAMLEGASKFRIYRKIVFPQLRGAIATTIVVVMMYALRSFDFIWVLTGGGPGYASHTLPIMMYKEAFQATRFAYGSAIASVLLVLVLLILVPYLYRTYRRGK